MNQTLVNRIRSGDHRAVQEWYATYQAEITRFVAVKVSSTVDVEEIVQETFIQCLKNISLFSGKAKLSSWMKSVAQHEIADFYRKKYAKRAIQTLPLYSLLLNQPIEGAHEVSEKVKLVLSHLRTDYQELLFLKYVDGKTVQLIAQELGRTVKSVEADLFRARRDFREVYVAIESR